jgi:hypothetical protein
MIGGDTIVSRDWANGYNLIIEGGKAVFAITDTMNNKQATSTTTILNTGWHYLVGTFDGSFVKIYVDGVMENSVSISGTTMSGSSDVFIGANNFGGSGAGTIEEVRIFNRALSASEIQTYYQQSQGFSSNLLVNVPQGMTDFIATLSWQGTGSINATIQTPSGTYIESNATDVYQKTTYSVSGGTSAMLNIKRIEVSVSALASSQSWYIVLATSNVQTYQISAETQT